MRRNGDTVGGDTGPVLTQKQINMADNITIAAAKRARFLELFDGLLSSYREDIETGIESSLYDPNENIETQAFIKECEDALAEQKEYRPAIYVYVEGGNVQGMSGTELIDVNLYDKDNADVDQEYIDNNGTSNQWNEKIDTMTQFGEITDIY